MNARRCLACPSGVGMTAPPPASLVADSHSSIVNLNVGGCRFATSKHTLTWIPETFFTSLISGRIPSIRDEAGAIFIDRDPDTFRVILNYLRTKQVDLSSISACTLKHEAQYYGLAPLVRRLTLCEELEDSACGNVLFHGIVPAPNLPMELIKSEEAASMTPSPESSRPTSNTTEDFDSANGTNDKTATDAQYGYCTHSRTSSADLHSSSCSRQFVPSHFKRSSYDLNKYIRFELNSLKKQTSSTGSRALREREADRLFPLRVRLIRAHHNSIAVAYPHYVCVFRMKESVGWQCIYTSPRLHSPVRHIALNTKFGAQGTDKMLALAFCDGSVHLYGMIEGAETGAIKIGNFSLDVAVDKLFFIGGQLVALSRSGKVGIWHSMTQNWQVQDVVSTIACYDTAGSSLILGCANGSMYYVDMQKFPLRMKDNDLLVTELYKDPNGDAITAISVYLTPKTTVCGNWIEIAYGTSSGTVRVIVQHPETVGHGPQLFQTYTVHASPITRVALTTHHLISVCAEYNHVRSWGVTRFRGMISTQPGSVSLASFKVLTLDSAEDPHSDYTDAGPYGDQEGEQVFVQRVVPDTNQLFVRLASNGDRLCTIRSVDGASITSFIVHECEGSTRIGCRPRRFLFIGTANGNVQMWDLTTAMDHYYSTRSALSGGGSGSALCSAGASSTSSSASTNERSSHTVKLGAPLLAALSGPSPQELLQLIDECELCCQSRTSTPIGTPHASAVNLTGLDYNSSSINNK